MRALLVVVVLFLIVIAVLLFFVLKKKPAPPAQIYYDQQQLAAFQAQGLPPGTPGPSRRGPIPSGTRTHAGRCQAREPARG